MSADRATSTVLDHVLAECTGCPGRWASANAQGVAARHHDATGHVVTVQVTRTTTYGDPQAAQASLLDAIQESTR